MLKNVIGSAFTSVSPRTSAPVEPEKNSFMKVFCMISPVIIYMLYVTLLTELSGYILAGVADMSEGNARYISANRILINAAIRSVIILTVILTQIPALIGEKPILIHRDDRSSTVRRALYCIILGISAAVTLNIVIGMSGLSGLSAGYDSIADRQFSLPVAPGILLYGLISPIGEEIIFRGLVYNRMRRNITFGASVVLSSLFFGIYHFNIVQCVYGTLMGLIIVWIYERYGAFIYPVLIHASANIFIYIVSTTQGGIQRIMTPSTLMVSGVIVILIIYRVLSGDRDSGIKG